MPAITLPLVSASIGLLLSWSVRSRSGAAADPNRGTWLVVTYTLLLHAPVSATLLALNPDWSFAYLLGPRRLQTAAVVAASLCVAFAVPFGFHLGSVAAAKSPLFWLKCAGPLLLLAGLNTMAFIRPLTKDASFVEYHNDFGIRSLAGSALGYSLIWAALMIGIALVFTHTSLRRLAADEQGGRALVRGKQA